MYEDCIQWKQTTDLTVLFPTMVGSIDGAMNVSDDVWMWMHQKYERGQIVQKLYSIEANKLTYLAVPSDGRLNQQSN